MADVFAQLSEQVAGTAEAVQPRRAAFFAPLRDIDPPAPTAVHATQLAELAPPILGAPASDQFWPGAALAPLIPPDSPFVERPTPTLRWLAATAPIKEDLTDLPLVPAAAPFDLTSSKDEAEWATASVTEADAPSMHAASPASGANQVAEASVPPVTDSPVIALTLSDRTRRQDAVAQPSADRSLQTGPAAGPPETTTGVGAAPDAAQTMPASFTVAPVSSRWATDQETAFDAEAPTVRDSQRKPSALATAPLEGAGADWETAFDAEAPSGRDSQRKPSSLATDSEIGPIAEGQRAKGDAVRTPTIREGRDTTPSDPRPSGRAEGRDTTPSAPRPSGRAEGQYARDDAIRPLTVREEAAIPSGAASQAIADLNFTVAPRFEPDSADTPDSTLRPRREMPAVPEQTEATVGRPQPGADTPAALATPNPVLTAQAAGALVRSPVSLTDDMPQTHHTALQPAPSAAVHEATAQQTVTQRHSPADAVTQSQASGSSAPHPVADSPAPPARSVEATHAGAISQPVEPASLALRPNPSQQPAARTEIATATEPERHALVQTSERATNLAETPKKGTAQPPFSDRPSRHPQRFIQDAGVGPAPVSFSDNTPSVHAMRSEDAPARPAGGAQSRSDQRTTTQAVAPAQRTVEVQTAGATAGVLDPGAVSALPSEVRQQVAAGASELRATPHSWRFDATVDGQPAPAAAPRIAPGSKSPVATPQVTHPQAVQSRRPHPARPAHHGDLISKATEPTAGDSLAPAASAVSPSWGEVTDGRQRMAADQPPAGSPAQPRLVPVTMPPHAVNPRAVRSAPPPPLPTVHVTIGRVEVHFAAPKAVPATRRPERRSISLDEMLKRDLLGAP